MVIVQNVDGQTVGIGVILADITETKQAEAAGTEYYRLHIAAANR